jgi:hypothetical protein
MKPHSVDSDWLRYEHVLEADHLVVCELREQIGFPPEGKVFLLLKRCISERMALSVRHCP